MSERNPRRGEIWLVNFDPTVGAEIRKTRPAMVLSSDALGRLPLKLVAPLTGWKDAFARSPWHVRLDPTSLNGLAKASAVDVLQLRGVDTRRFVARIGVAGEREMVQIVSAIGIVVEA